MIHLDRAKLSVCLGNFPTFAYMLEVRARSVSPIFLQGESSQASRRRERRRGTPHAVREPMLPYALTAPPSSRERPGSGERPRFPSFRPDETLGAASYVVLSALRLDFVDDEADTACRACGTEPLRAAAWLRSRRAAVGHAVSEMRVHDDGGAAYSIMARTRSGPRAPCNVSFGNITSARLAAWVRPDRMAIVIVGAQWPTAVTGVPHALVVVGARRGQLSVFDPAGSGNVQEVSTTCLDIVRAGPEAWAEVLCVGRRMEAPQLRLVHAGYPG